MESTPRASALADSSSRNWVALLGRGEYPADGVVDYCETLRKALASRNVLLELVRIDWPKLGWWSAFRQLWRAATDWRGRWVILQFTSLAWSRRGFPFGALAALAILRRRGARCAVMFHEPFGEGGPGLIGKTRRACQNWVVKRLYLGTAKSVFPVPLETVPWLPGNAEKAMFIPIGSNIPERISSSNRWEPPADRSATSAIAVFCLSGPPVLKEELADLAGAARVAAADSARFRLIFLGRGTAEATPAIARAFEPIGVEVSVLGIVAPDKVADALESCSAMLCVRGSLYPRRGSALAGIACGLPIIGYAGAERSTSLEKAGILFVPYRDGRAMGRELARLLADPALQRELREMNRGVQREVFSWDLIADSFIRTLTQADDAR